MMGSNRCIDYMGVSVLASLQSHFALTEAHWCDRHVTVKEAEAQRGHIAMK